MANGYVKEMPYRWRSVVIDGLVDGWCFERLREGLREAGMPEEQLPTDKNLRTYRDGDEEYKEVCRHLRFQQAARHVQGGMAADSAALDAYAESLLLRETSLRVMDGSFGPAELCKGMNAVTRLSRTRFQRRVAEATCARQDRAEATANSLGLTGGVLGGAMGGGRPLAGGRASGGMATREQLFTARAEGEAALWLEGMETMMEGMVSAYREGLAGMSVAARRAVGVALAPLANLLAGRRGAVERVFPAETSAAVEESFGDMVQVIRTLSVTGELPAAAMAGAGAEDAEDAEWYAEADAEEAAAAGAAGGRDGEGGMDGETAAWLDRRETEGSVGAGMEDEAADADAGKIGSLAWFMAGDDGEEEEDIVSVMTKWHPDAVARGERGQVDVVYAECKADDADDCPAAAGQAAPVGTAAVLEATGGSDCPDATVGTDGAGESDVRGDGAAGGDAADAVRGGGGGAACGEAEGGVDGRVRWKVPPFLCGPGAGVGSDMLVLTDDPRYARSQAGARAGSGGSGKGAKGVGGTPGMAAKAGARTGRPLSLQEAATVAEMDRIARQWEKGGAAPVEGRPRFSPVTEAEFLASIHPNLAQVAPPEVYAQCVALHRCLTTLTQGDLKANLERLLGIVTALDMAHMFQPFAAMFHRAGQSRLLPDSARLCRIMPDLDVPPPGVSRAAWQAARAKAGEELLARERTGRGRG